MSYLFIWIPDKTSLIRIDLKWLFFFPRALDAIDKILDNIVLAPSAEKASKKEERIKNLKLWCY